VTGTILRARADLVALADAVIDDDGRQWIEVLPTADKTRNGRWYFTITRDDLDAYASYIAANADRIMVDRDHEGADGGSTKAAGWFTGQTKIVDDADRGPILTAQVQWTPTARKEIEDGEFKFVSAEFGFEDKDAKTGLLTVAKDFVAATLTNRPFFTELAALAADEGPVLWDADQGVNELQSDLEEALNPGASNYDAIRYWVCDVDVAGQRALITAAGPGDDAWIVPYQRDADGNITVPPSSDWIAVEKAWVADTDDGPGMASRARLVALAAARTAEIESCTSGDTSGYRAKGGDTCHTHDGTSDGIGKAKQAAMRDAMKQAAAAAALTNGGSAATTQEATVSEELKALAATLGLPEDATVEQINEAAETAKASVERVAELETELEAAKAAQNGGGDRVITVDKEQLAQLRRDAEQGVTARRTQLGMEADGLVKTAVDDGRIAPASKDAWRTAILPENATELVTSEVEALSALAKGRVPVEERVIAGSAAGDAQLDTVLSHLGLKTAVNS
jgi:phage I-like protein